MGLNNYHHDHHLCTATRAAESGTAFTALEERCIRGLFFNFTFNLNKLSQPASQAHRC